MERAGLRAAARLRDYKVVARVLRALESDWTPDRGIAAVTV